MFCRNCGKELPEGTRFCPECGKELTVPENSIPAASYEPAPNNHMILGILTTVFCCMIFGIISIVYASRVDSYWNAGNKDAAIEFSKKARSWALWGIGLTIFLIAMYFILILAGVIGSAYFMDAVDF